MRSDGTGTPNATCFPRTQEVDPTFDVGGSRVGRTGGDPATRGWMVLLGDARHVCQFTRGRFESGTGRRLLVAGIQTCISARIAQRRSGRRCSAEPEPHARMILADGRVVGL